MFLLQEADIETQTEHWPRLLRHITMEMTSRCRSMSLREISEGICLCSKLLSKVMPSMKTVEKPGRDSSMSITGSDKPEGRYGNHSSSETKTDELNDLNFRGDLQSSSTDSSSSSARKGRVVQVARISVGENELSGWSVVDLRKRLENGATGAGDQQSYDEESELTESGKTTDETTDKKDVLKTNEDKNEKKNQERSTNDSNKEDIEQDDYEEWMECQESVDVINTGGFDECVTKDECVTIDERVTKDEQSGDQASSADSPNHSFQPSLIQSCIDYFQSFFSEFVNQRIIASSTNVAEFGQTAPSSRKNSEFLLDKLLNTKKCSENRNTEGQKDGSDLDKEKDARRWDKRLPWEQQSSLLCAEAFAAACRLLVELSCFPVYCTNDLVTDNQTDGKLTLDEIKPNIVICRFFVCVFACF
jgi:hypothetical protein